MIACRLLARIRESRRLAAPDAAQEGRERLAQLPQYLLFSREATIGKLRILGPDSLQFPACSAYDLMPQRNQTSMR